MMDKLEKVMDFVSVITSYHKGERSLRYLANVLAILGPGKTRDENENLVFPQEPLELAYNELIHCILKGEGVLDELRGFFMYDSTLEEDHELKLLSKPFDADFVLFLSNTPDCRYFPKKH